MDGQLADYGQFRLLAGGRTRHLSSVDQMLAAGIDGLRRLLEQSIPQ
jgi:hypothetical protein